MTGSGTIKATYDYVDEAGLLLFQVVRFEPKDFRQRQPAGDGEWVYHLNGVRRVLYRLPQLQGQRRIVIVEGEKDADRLWSVGIPATTSPMGAGKWRPEYAESLRAAGTKQVIILPDNDKAGQDHAGTVAKSCILSHMQSKIIPLPGLGGKGDVSDWLDAGHDPAALVALFKVYPPIRLGQLLDADAPQQERRTHRFFDSAAYREKLNLSPDVHGEIMVMCPFHVDSKPSLNVNLDEGLFYCHGGCTKPKGGGPREFLAKWKKKKESAPCRQTIPRTPVRPSSPRTPVR